MWWFRTAAADRDDWKFLDLGFSDEEKILTVRGDGYTELTKGEASPAPLTRLFQSSRTHPARKSTPPLDFRWGEGGNFRYSVTSYRWAPHLEWGPDDHCRGAVG